jgi:hypothetical protein
MAAVNGQSQVPEVAFQLRSETQAQESGVSLFIAKMAIVQTTHL